MTPRDHNARRDELAESYQDKDFQRYLRDDEQRIFKLGWDAHESELQARVRELESAIKKTLEQCGSLHKPIYFLWLREALSKDNPKAGE